jgi:NADH:ubiquinone reductase (H+-translocating)
MAELLILVVIAGVVLLYAVDRVRKLRARARQMSGMNERLDVAAAKVDAQQERKQARFRASAELTSVMPAIGRPPLTLPGVPGSAAGPAGEPAAPEPDAGPAAERAASNPPAAAGGTPAAADDTPAAADARNIPDAGAEESPAAQAAPDQAGSPVATAAPRLQGTPDGTMIMPPVPDQGPAPADGVTRPPAFSRPRPRTSRPPAGQPRAREPRASRSRAAQPHAGQPRPSQPGSSQPGSARPGTSHEQSNRD